MELLKFKKEETLEDSVSTELTHVSIVLDEGSYSVKEERGLEETVRAFNNKTDLIEYLTKEL